MTAVDIRKMDDQEIVTKIAELKKELFDLRFQQAVGQLEDTAKLGKVKKTIARLKTVLNERKEGAK